MIGQRCPIANFLNGVIAMQTDVIQLLEAVKLGKIEVVDAYKHLQMAPFIEVRDAVIDQNRKIRQGLAEVIYGESKTAEQIERIVKKMLEEGEEDLLITRLSKKKAKYLEKVISADLFKYFEAPRVAVVNPMQERKSVGNILIASGGTSDIGVCEEAAITAELMGNHVERMYDVGVAGLHRLLNKLDIISRARVVIVVAGMEGALASVIGGIVDVPVIAVPTSVGYGANFNGLSALLSMLNSCASGVSVVNIDNGFGAGVLASRINQMEGL